ncbi:MAG: hypothetical protein OXH15_09960 [Gammaproteobacteria bacterium]|nr:hypothetical protein [Gammaproteobacteria bacterium]
MIRDEQEGRAYNEEAEREEQEYVAERSEQEQALHQLGVRNVKLGPHTSRNSNRSTESYTFGTGSWIFCTAIRPASRDEWGRLSRKLPATYNDFTTIHQPRKFAQALGLMFIDQLGPNSKGGKFTHKATGTKSVVSSHDSLKVLHGPVLYTSNVYDFLNAHQESALAKIYPLFVKDVEHKDQREYRFVIVANDDLGNRSRDIEVSGMMRDALLPVARSSSVNFEVTPDGDKEGLSIGVTPKQYSKRKNQRWTKTETRTRVIKISGEERQREEQTREVVVSLISEATLSGEVTPDLLEGEERNTGNVVERQRERVEVDGVPIEMSDSERVRVGIIANVDDADEFFSIEERKEAEEIIGRARDIGRNVTDRRELEAAVSQLVGATVEGRNKGSMEVTSAAWHGLVALVNLNEHFGDVVESVGVENGPFVAISLKGSAEASADGKLLVGPLGTYAYVLRRGEECMDNAGGEECKLVLFPDEEDVARFAEFGWPSREQEAGEE